MKSSYVQVAGGLHQVRPDGSLLVEGVEWRCYAGRWAPEDSSFTTAPIVMPDIAPYRSMIDGSLIGSRSTHREHLRAHDCIEVGNEKPKPKNIPWTATQGLKQEIVDRINSRR